MRRSSWRPPWKYGVLFLFAGRDEVSCFFYVFVFQINANTDIIVITIIYIYIYTIAVLH